MSLTSYVLLAALLMSSIGQSPLNNDSLEVILSLQHLHQAHCVFLVASEASSLSAVERIVQALKMLAGRGVFTAHVGLEDSEHAHRCHMGRPLNVVLGGDEATLEDLRRLEKVSPHPRWVTFLEGNTTTALQGVNLDFDAEFLVVRAHKQGKGEGSAVFQAYRESAHSLLLQHFADFTPGGGLDMKGRDFGARSRNLHGGKIRVCVLNIPPLVEVVDVLGMPLKVSGFLRDVWDMLEAELNFTTEYLISPSRVSSALLGNGTWTGCMATIQRRLADVSFSDLTMTIVRMQLVEHVYPAFTTNNRYYLLEPTAVNLNWDNFLSPFAPRLWLAVASSVALLSLALLVTHRCAHRFGAEQDDLQASQAVIYMLGLACGQGHDTTPRAASGRIVYQIGALFGIVVCAAYAAALISFLTVEIADFPIKTFEDLLANGLYKLGIRFGSGQFTLYETTTDPLLRKVYAKLLQPTIGTLPASDEEGLLRVCAEPNYGFVAYPELISSGKRLPCRIVPAPGIFLPARYAFAVAKGNPFRDTLNTAMLRLRSSGALRGLHLRYWPKTYPTTKSEFNSVSIEESTPILAVLIGGVSLGALLLLLERVIALGIVLARRNGRSKKQRRDILQHCLSTVNSRRNGRRFAFSVSLRDERV